MMKRDKKNRYWKNYVQLYRGQYRNLFVSIFLSIIQAVSVIPVALIIKSIFDKAIPENDFNRLLILSIMIVFLYMLSGTLTLITRNITLKTTKSVIKDVRDRIICKFYDLPKLYFTGTDRMKLHAGIVQDTFRLDVMSNGLVAQLFPSALISTGLLLILLYLNPLLFLLVILITPFIGFIGKLIGRKLKNKVNLYHRVFENFSSKIMVLLNIMDLTRAETNEEKESEDQRELHVELEKKSFDQAWYGAFYRIFNETAVSSFGMVILVAGGFQVMKGKMTLGGLFAFFAALGLLKKYVLTISGVIPWVIEGNESLMSVFGFLDEEHDLPYSGGDSFKFRGSIILENVSFNYTGEKLLENISFELKPGRITCITGANGSGKSTLISLILGFYRPDKGKILADGKEYDSVNIKDIRKSTGVVFQNTIIFPGSVRENISYGDVLTGNMSLNTVLEISQLNDLIQRMPSGLDTIIDERGDKLSGGELRRISIARAVSGDKKMIIMDEPSTYLEMGVLEKIFINLKKYLPDASILLITHNKDVLTMCDDIYELKDFGIRSVLMGRN
ncbi:MAG: ABC transporter ATP-binding protein [Acidobacteriota bacterium]